MKMHRSTEAADTSCFEVSNQLFPAEQVQRKMEWPEKNSSIMLK